MRLPHDLIQEWQRFLAAVRLAWLTTLGYILYSVHTDRRISWNATYSRDRSIHRSVPALDRGQLARFWTRHAEGGLVARVWPDSLEIFHWKQTPVTRTWTVSRVSGDGLRGTQTAPLRDQVRCRGTRSSGYVARVLLKFMRLLCDRSSNELTMPTRLFRFAVTMRCGFDERVTNRCNVEFYWSCWWTLNCSFTSS